MTWVKPEDELPNNGQMVVIAITKFNKEKLSSYTKYFVARFRAERLFIVDNQAYLDTEIIAWTPIVPFYARRVV